MLAGALEIELMSKLALLELFLGFGSVWSLWKALSLIEPKMSLIYYRKCSLEAFFADPSKTEVRTLIWGLGLGSLLELFLVLGSV